MFGGGGGGLDSRKMQQMMKQMGIDIDDIDAEEVIIRTQDEELVFNNPEVQRMDAQGQETYTVVGSPESRALGDSAGGAAEADAGDGDDADADEGIPKADVDIVAQRTGSTEDAAREALEATDGDLAAAVERLE